jgi:hypothetical protein
MKDESIWSPVEQYIHKLQDRFIQPTAFYPSSASCKVDGKIIGGWDSCLRKQYYKWKGVIPTNKIVYRSWLSARLGDAFESAFLDAYESQGLLKGRNIPFYTELMGLPIAGRIDGLTKKGEIIECKSGYGTAFSYSLKDKPKIENFPQILVYLAVLGLDTCILPYGSRDNTGFRSGFKITKQEIEKDGIILVKILKRWRALQMCVETNIVPERDFDLFNDWNCSYCEYFREGEDKRGCYTQAQIDEYFAKKKKKE